MLDISKTDNISEFPFNSPFNIEVFIFDSCIVIKGGLASM